MVTRQDLSLETAGPNPAPATRAKSPMGINPFFERGGMTSRSCYWYERRHRQHVHGHGVDDLRLGHDDQQPAADLVSGCRPDRRWRHRVQEGQARGEVIPAGAWAWPAPLLLCVEVKKPCSNFSRAVPACSPILLAPPATWTSSSSSRPSWPLKSALVCSCFFSMARRNFSEAPDKTRIADCPLPRPVSRREA